MNKTADRVRAGHSKQPQKQKHEKESPKHPNLFVRSIA